MASLKRNPDGTVDESVFEPDFDLVANWKALFASVVACAVRDYFYGKRALNDTRSKAKEARDNLKAFKNTMTPGNPKDEKKLERLKKKAENAVRTYAKMQDKIRSTQAFFKSESLILFTDIPGDKMLETLDKYIEEGRTNLPGVSDYRKNGRSPKEEEE